VSEGQWQEMPRLSPTELPPDALRNQNVFVAEPKLERGKYPVSFKARNRLGELEELSGVTLIIN
jgi:hypothetical protein